MRKIILLCVLVIGMMADAQTVQTIAKPLKLNIVAQGTAADSVLVRGADKIVKFVPRSQFGGGSQVNADWNATTGVFLSTREHSDFNKVLIEDPNEYWKIVEDRHPLLFLRRCYFTSDTDLDKPVYIMGEHGDKNSFFMFPRSESVLCLVFLPTVNQTLKTVMEHQLKFLGGSENPKKKNLFISKTKFSIDMLSLYNREIQRSLKSFGTDQFYFKNANNIGLIHANKESIIDELNPQYLGFQFEDKVKNVEEDRKSVV